MLELDFQNDQDEMDLSEPVSPLKPVDGQQITLENVEDAIIQLVFFADFKQRKVYIEVVVPRLDTKIKPQVIARVYAEPGSDMDLTIADFRKRMARRDPDRLNVPFVGSCLTAAALAKLDSDNPPRWKPDSGSSPQLVE